MSEFLNTSQVVNEVVDILNQSSIFSRVSTEKITPLAEEDSNTAAYVGVKAISYELVKASNKPCGYNRSLFLTVDINVQCSYSPLELLDVIDKTERAILNDSSIWSVVIDRTMVGVELDELQFYPKRTATMLLEVTYRISNE